MIRALDWRDLSLLRRLRDRGVCLDAQQAFCRGHHTLANTLLGLVSPTLNVHTLVSRPDGPEDPAAVAQILHHNSDTLARLAFITPEGALSSASGLALLEGVCQAAGERGALNLAAEVDEDSPAFAGLRRAGFAIYARQNVWALPTPAEAAREGRPDAQSRQLWRTEIGSDRSAVHFLYANLVPALVQQIEPPPARGSRGLVYWQGGELLGYLEVERGPLGTWVQPYFHPAVEQTHALLVDLLAHGPVSRARPVFVCVRSYQGWMNGLLERLGFGLCASQAVMVKRLAATVRRPALARLPAIEGTRAEPTAPIVRLHDRPPAPKAGQRP
ncbi:MAG: hypothetical protein A2Y93_05775 [Chloroflexi bacterium RBG_13_68_17]|jgi:hypothetical protein|nr:MAG: hypothetical protein A2Y93_05775 [Chloroflexi bacterium RBG_13_68_17]